MAPPKDIYSTKRHANYLAKEAKEMKNEADKCLNVAISGKEV